MEYRECICQKK